MNSDISTNAIVVRAFKTFVQGFLAVLLAGATTSLDGAGWKALVIGAFAAGISALMNLFIQPTEAK